MRVFNTNISQEGMLKYTYNSIEYIYCNGNLYEVTFCAGESYVAITAQDYDKYPLNSDTFQSKILNLETAEKAITHLFGEIRPLVEFYATAPTSTNEITDTEDIFYR